MNSRFRATAIGGGSGRPLLRDPAEEGLSGRRGRDPRAQPARRHLRLRRRLLGRDALASSTRPTPRASTEIRARFRTWSDIETHFRGRLRRSRADTASRPSRAPSCSRSSQRRAAELGCELALRAARSRADERSPRSRPRRRLRRRQQRACATLRRRASAARRARRAAASPGSAPTCRSTAFTFLFVETPHGLFQVHAYPYRRRAARPSSSRRTEASLARRRARRRRPRRTTVGDLRASCSPPSSAATACSPTARSGAGSRP